MKNKQNNKTKNPLAVIALFISLLTIVVLIFILIRIEGFSRGDSYSSLLIGSLTLIVTVLIGYQISNIVQLDNRFTALETRTRDTINSALNEHLQLSKQASKKAENDAIGTALMMLAWTFMGKGETDDALRTLINSLRAYQQGDLEDPTIVSQMKDVEDSLITIAHSESGTWKFQNINEKNVFIDTIMKIQNRDKMNILLDFFYRFDILT